METKGYVRIEQTTGFGEIICLHRNGYAHKQNNVMIKNVPLKSHTLLTLKGISLIKKDGIIVMTIVIVALSAFP